MKGDDYIMVINWFKVAKVGSTVLKVAGAAIGAYVASKENEEAIKKFCDNYLKPKK